MFDITQLFSEYITSSKPLFHNVCPCMMPTHSYSTFSQGKGYQRGGLLERLWETENNLRGEERENAGSWIIEQITFVWVQGERERPRERDSPLILPCLVWYVGSHWGERFMANWSGSNIPWKAASGSIATILEGHINPLLYVVLSVQ